MSWTKSKADVFPLEKRIEIIDELLPQSLMGNSNATAMLIHLYNAHIAPGGEEMSYTCGLCVEKVQKIFIEIKRYWTQ